MAESSTTSSFAGPLFDAIAQSYDQWAQRLSLFQYLRWRRQLVSLLKTPPDGRVLDVCTGTAGVALEVSRLASVTVVGLDLSTAMLGEAARRVHQTASEDKIRLVRGQAQALPFRDSSFDVVLFTFLLRYVEDPEA